MRTKFWRFAYDNDLLEAIVASDRLYFPDLKKWPVAQNSNEEKILTSIKEGHFILLANFDHNSEAGTVRGVGKVITMHGDSCTVLWKKPVPSWYLTPDRRGGVKEWNNEGVFCFDVQPAKRYKLASLTQKLFKDAE